MTDTATNHTPAVAAPGRIGQGTAVEQSRAIAEVQAAVVVAQQVPRDTSTARAAMQDSCAMIRLAERAFYRFPRGRETVTGASVYLAKELARCWGNVQHGIAELRRDDEAGESEMMAWAWDVQTNTRSSTTFIVPHRRDKKGGAVPIVDLRDIYENNANMGSRRLREQIFSILPPWFVEEAKDICAATMEKGDGKPLGDRIAGAISVFDGIGVSQVRLEQKMGRPADRWNAYDIAQLTTIHRSIHRREVAVDDEFPPPRVTREELGSGSEATGSEPTPVAPAPDLGQVDERPPTKTQVSQLSSAISGAGIGDGLAWATRLCGREIAAYEDLTRDEVARLLGEIEGGG